MENEYYEEEKESQDEHVEIYSKMAIRGFSIFFSTIFGGVLLMINLRNAGYKQAANVVLAFSIGYTLVSSILVGALHANNLVGLCLNFAGGMILSEYFFPKYFPDNDYYPKPIWSALGVSLIICLTLFLFLYYNGGLPQLNKAMGK